MSGCSEAGRCGEALRPQVMGIVARRPRQSARPREPVRSPSSMTFPFFDRVIVYRASTASAEQRAEGMTRSARTKRRRATPAKGSPADETNVTLLEVLRADRTAAVRLAALDRLLE